MSFRTSMSSWEIISFRSCRKLVPSPSTSPSAAAQPKASQAPTPTMIWNWSLNMTRETTCCRGSNIHVGWTPSSKELKSRGLSWMLSSPRITCAPQIRWSMSACRVFRFSSLQHPKIFKKCGQEHTSGRCNGTRSLACCWATSKRNSISTRTTRMWQLTRWLASQST